MVHRHRLSTLSLAFAFSSSLCACIGDQVDLGESTNPSTPRGALCANSTTLDGDVTAGSQEELNELAGCEVITGNFYISPFLGPDFTPLGSLERVDGTLDIGRLSVLDRLDVPEDESAAQFALLDSGWIESFEGFEQLTSVGSLWLRGILAPSLAPLSNLRTLTNGGTLSIGPCLNLADLQGLENLTGIVDVSLSCDSLVSLRGLNVPRRMREFSVIAPQLTDLGDFHVEELTSLQLYGTQLTHLDALSQLTSASRIDIYDNGQLTNADGLDALQGVEELTISANGRLTELPEFAALGHLGGLRVTSNAALRNLPIIPTLMLQFDGRGDYRTRDYPDPWANAAPEDIAYFTPDFVIISANPSLEDVTLPAGWIGSRLIEIAGNSRLRSITLNTTRSADYLGIDGNPVLESVDLGDLTQAARLVVADNPLLPLDGFDDVQSFDRVVTSGPAVPEEPAP